MTKTIFTSFLKRAQMLTSADYHRGYAYGLRRHFHGQSFGDDQQLQALQQRGGGTAQGLSDGLSGQEPRIYCSQNNGDCQGCSLVKYGMDCRNRPIGGAA